MRSRSLSSVVTRLSILVCSTALAALALGSTASAATPTSLTNCWGSVAADSGGKAADEPNLLDYKFRCNYSITAYTVTVSQLDDRQFGGTIDDYLPAPAVFEADGKTPSPTETVTCDGTTPGYGINCNYGTVGASMTAGYWADGSIDPTSPYCKHLPIDAKGQTIDKPGTVAVPKAIVSLVVNDTTGGQDGPFILGHAKTCPTVPSVVPAPKAKPSKPSKKSGGRGHQHKGHHA